MVKMTTDSRRFSAIGLVEQFWDQAWSPPHRLETLRPLVVPDITLVCGGRELNGVEAVIDWLQSCQAELGSVEFAPEETFASVDASRVTSRWRVQGQNRGVCGLPADGRRIEVTGIAIWSIRWDRSTPRLCHAWLERNLWEVFEGFTTATGTA